MQDPELVAAIVNGDPDGLAEVYDRYAASLYAYCRSLLPDPHPPGEAADAVADTFTIAAAKLEGLRDPDQLGSWLHAVARNECLRRLGAAGLGAAGLGAAGLGAAGLAADAARLAPASADAARLAPADAARLGAVGAVPQVSPPDALRERVLQAGADNTPTGRADRVSVTHRAGAFGRTGFPKPIIPAGPRWWHGVRRRPRATAGVAAVAVAAVAGGIAVLLIAGGTHRARASTVALGGGNFGTSAAPSIAASSQAGAQSSPGRRPTPASGSPSTATSPTDGPTASQSTSPDAPRSSAPTPSSPPPSPSPSPSPSPPPTPGTLQVTPNDLVLSAVKGKPASGTFIVTAVGGPVNFAVTSPNGKVTVSPPSGSLGAAGSWITVTVTVRSNVALNARLIVSPGNLVVTVRFSIKA
jgi:DNA-directed RNA polymerase specialized sigma24 family protein